MIEKHPFFDKAIQFLDDNKFQPGIANANFASYSDSQKITEYHNAPCHATFSYDSSASLISTGFLHAPNQKEAAKTFLNWVLGDKSPWRYIAQNELYIHENEKEYKGILFGEDVYKSIDFKFIKNFCIMLRFPGEFTENFSSWDFLVNLKNVDPRDAFIISKFFSLNGNKLKLYVKYGGHNGAHHSLTNKIGNRSLFDWNKYWNGLAYKSDETVNGFFMSEESKLSLFVPKVYDGSYTISGKIFEVDQVLDEYFQWKEKSGIKDV